MSCPPSWIIEDMHVTSPVGSRQFFIATASGDQYEPETRVLVAISNFEWNKNI